MKKLLISIPLIILFALLLVGCDKDPLDSDTVAAAESGKLPTNGGSNSSSKFTPGSMNITCSGTGSKPSNNVHCLTVSTATAPHYFGPTSVFSGSSITGIYWKNSIGCRMKLNDDGTGTFRASSTGSNQSIKWGILINKNGASAGGSTNLYVNMVEADYGDLIDAQYGAAGYVTSSGLWSNGWVKE